MGIKQAVEKWLLKCAAVYPDYATLDAPMMKAKAAVFAEMLGNLTEEQLDKAFGYHLKAKSKFPTPADLIASLTPVNMYRFDNGPNGGGALYAADHPYVALQRRLGLERMESYMETVCEADGVSIAALEAEARSLPSIPIDRTIEHIQDGEDRRGGFRQIGFDVH